MEVLDAGSELASVLLPSAEVALPPVTVDSAAVAVLEGNVEADPTSLEVVEALLGAELEASLELGTAGLAELSSLEHPKTRVSRNGLNWLERSFTQAL